MKRTPSNIQLHDAWSGNPGHISHAQPVQLGSLLAAPWVLEGKQEKRFLGRHSDDCACGAAAAAAAAAAQVIPSPLPRARALSAELFGRCSSPPPPFARAICPKDCRRWLRRRPASRNRARQPLSARRLCCHGIPLLRTLRLWQLGFCTAKCRSAAACATATATAACVSASFTAAAACASAMRRHSTRSAACRDARSASERGAGSTHGHRCGQPVELMNSLLNGLRHCIWYRRQSPGNAMLLIRLQNSSHTVCLVRLAICCKRLETLAELVAAAYIMAAAHVPLQ